MRLTVIATYVEIFHQDVGSSSGNGNVYKRQHPRKVKIQFTQDPFIMDREYQVRQKIKDYPKLSAVP